MKAAGHASTPKVESGVKGEVTLRISPNAVRVLKKRYLAKDENGKVFETPEGMFRRVAHNLVQADALYGATPEAVRATEEEFYAVTAGLDFLPNSPTLMKAALNGEMYDLVNPRSGKVVRQLNAREVLHKIAECAWRNGEPGLFFIDQANRTNPTPHYAMIEATNPCGEQPLLPYESCNLGSVNLETHVVPTQDGRCEIDWARLEQSIRTSVHLLDNVIDMNKYPIPEIEKCTKDNRKIGLGVMGFARMLFKLGIQYDSEAGLQMGEQVMKFISEIGYDESRRMAEQRGVYASWKGSLHEARGQRVRNSYVTTVAPTGTISMIADTSGGCEPEFSLIWFKNVMDGEHLPYVLDLFIETAKREGFWLDGLLDKILTNHGSARGIPEIPERWQKVFATAHDIAPEWHVRMQT